MADEEQRLQTEILKRQEKEIAEQNTAIKDLLKQARDTGVSAKEQLKLVKTQQQLEKSRATLSKDLGKNFQDMKDGLSSQFEGFTSGMLGPFGGIANSLTTGFFKRKKQNDENIAQNEALLEQAAEQSEKMGGLVEKATITEDTIADVLLETSEVKNVIEEVGEKIDMGTQGFLKSAEDLLDERKESSEITNDLLGVLVDATPTAEELEEANKKKAAAAGGVVDVKQEKPDEGGLLAMLFNPKAIMGWVAGLGTALFGALQTVLGPVAIITALAMAIKDGMMGWAKSDEWGTSKISGFLGGFLGGDKSGWEGAFSNAGKWAIAGAGIGFMAALVPGAIAGGLLGAAIGGILGYIGGEKLAKGFDGIGAWFKKQFDDLILAPIKAVWDFIAPEWAKSVTDNMEWSDLLPPGLNKLFNGEYFTFDFPKFTWTDLFPKFLVDLFENVTKVAAKETWSWMDLLPPFLTKFFTGEYAPGKQEFKWQDLVPEFIWKIAEVAKTAWAETPFTWRSLVPNFILKIVDGFTQTGEFQWSDLVPKFITDLVTAGAAEATKTGEFSWKALLPDWMIGAWDSTKGLAAQGADAYFSWKSLLPEWIQGYLTDAEGGISTVLGKVSAFNWKSLLPTFIQDFIDDPTQLAKENYKFDWKSLLPQFIVNLIEGKPVFGGSEEGGSDALATGIDLSKINLVDTILRSVLELVPESFLGVGIRERVATAFGITADKDTYRGGIIATKPTWLPSSGTIVGEHSTWQGGGAAYGGIADGGAEAVIPLGADRAGVFIDPMAKSIAGQVMNQMAMERIAMQTGGGGASSAPVVMDNSTMITNNNTTTTITNPIGQMLPGESDDFVHKVA